MASMVHHMFRTTLMTDVEYNNYLMESYDFCQTTPIEKLGMLFYYRSKSLFQSMTMMQLFSQSSIFWSILNDGEIAE